EQQLDRFDAVDSQPPSLDHAFVSHPIERPECSLPCIFEDAQPLVAVEVLRHVMYEHDIDMIGFEPLQAVFDRTTRGLGGIVVRDSIGATILEHALFTIVAETYVFGIGEDDTSHLCADDILVARAYGECVAHADLRKASTVERGVVEVADAVD